MFSLCPQHVEIVVIRNSYGMDRQAAVEEVHMLHSALQSVQLLKISSLLIVYIFSDITFFI
jgi:hypothetical protein